MTCCIHEVKGVRARNTVYKVYIRSGPQSIAGTLSVSSSARHPPSLLHPFLHSLTELTHAVIPLTHSWCIFTHPIMLTVTLLTHILPPSLPQFNRHCTHSFTHSPTFYLTLSSKLTHCTHSHTLSLSLPSFPTLTFKTTPIHFYPPLTTRTPTCNICSRITL